mgnify:CR=1 FL=1
MLSKLNYNSSFGLDNKAIGLSNDWDYETILFDSFMDARGGNKGGNNKPTPTDDPVFEDPVPDDSYISGDEDVPDSEEFNIQIDFYGEWTNALKDDFIESADFISSLITNDIAPEIGRAHV